MQSSRYLYIGVLRSGHKKKSQSKRASSFPQLITVHLAWFLFLLQGRLDARILERGAQVNSKSCVSIYSENVSLILKPACKDEHI